MRIQIDNSNLASALLRHLERCPKHEEMAESQVYEDEVRSICAEKLLERCIDRQWGNSDVGNRGKNSGKKDT